MSDTPKDFTFDLTKITADEFFDVLEMSGKDPGERTPRDFVTVIKVLRRALVPGKDLLTGADVTGIIEGFFRSVNGGDETEKN